MEVTRPAATGRSHGFRYPSSVLDASATGTAISYDLRARMLQRPITDGVGQPLLEAVALRDAGRVVPA